MKTIGNFGDWVIAKGWWFVPSLILMFTLIYNASSTNKTAIIHGKEFECTATSAVGINSRCDQYTRIPNTQLGRQ